MDFSRFSKENLIRIGRVLKAVLDQLELKNGKSLFGYKISIKLLEKEGVLSDEAKSVLNLIDCIDIRNSELENMFVKFQGTYLTQPPFLISEKEVNENLFLEIKNFDELRKTYKEVYHEIEKLGKEKKNETDKKVGKIIIIKMSDGKISVAINDDYNNIKEVKDYSKTWQIFVKEIEDKDVRPENRTNVKEISKSMADYFNYNENCPIYMGGKYALSEIIIGRDIRMINPEIKTKIISEKQFSVLKKRNIKKLKTT